MGGRHFGRRSSLDFWRRSLPVLKLVSPSPDTASQQHFTKFEM